jgi:hypothetical protein
MSVEKIASDLAKKSYISRNLGGVVKAGEYAAWAEEYKDIAQEHYDSLKAEKQAAIDPLVLNTLIGGGLGAGAGALGSLGSEYLSGKKNKNRWRDALTYGLMGGLGGAGLGAAKQLLSDRNAIDKATTWAQGLPAKEYPSEELAAISKQINDKGIHNSTLTGGAANAAIQGTTGAAAGASAGAGVDKLLKKYKPESFRPSGVDPKELTDSLKKIAPSKIERSTHTKPIGDIEKSRGFIEEAVPGEKKLIPGIEAITKREFGNIKPTYSTPSGKILDETGRVLIDPRRHPREYLENYIRSLDKADRLKYFGQTEDIIHSKPMTETGPIKKELIGKTPKSFFRENSTPYVQESRRIPAVDPSQVFGFDKTNPLDLSKIEKGSLIERMTGGDPRKMEAVIRHVTGPEGKGFLENLAKVEQPSTNPIARFFNYKQTPRIPKIQVPEAMKPGIGKGTRIGGALGGLAGLTSAGMDVLNSSKSRAEIGNILSENIKKTLSSPEVANNPEYKKILSALAKETANGISLNRGNEIMKTLNNMFVQ